MSTARRIGLAAICCGFLMITVDATIVNVALGPIVNDLGGSLSGAQWIVSAYTLGFATFLLSAGAWADRIGSRAAYLIGLGIFALGSAACAAAPSMGALIAARAVQGLGAALLMPCSLALIAHAFPAGPERRGALAVWGGLSGVGLSAGPVIGGVLVDTVGWRYIFLVNLPLAALAAAGILAYVTETPATAIRSTSSARCWWWRRSAASAAASSSPGRSAGRRRGRSHCSPPGSRRRSRWPGSSASSRCR